MSRTLDSDSVSLPTMNYDALDHYRLNTGPTDEFDKMPECPPTIKNIGWTLGNDCPYRCQHCYSMNARQKGARHVRRDD
jgi:hypothetical protein